VTATRALTLAGAAATAVLLSLSVAKDVPHSWRFMRTRKSRFVNAAYFAMVWRRLTVL